MSGRLRPAKRRFVSKIKGLIMMLRLSAITVRAFSLGALLLANAAVLPAWGQAVVAPAASANAAPGSVPGPGRVLVKMPLVSSEVAKAFYASRTVPKSDVPPLVGE